jgi:8-oxo-dGTP pyrophosphatase MutT (NUDIX family)
VTQPIIRVVAAYITNAGGELLLVRKRGTEAFMNPGGKYEPGETAPRALVRELNEELGLVLAESELEYVGFFETAAANEPGHLLEAEVFRIESAASVSPLAEIDELRWVDPHLLADTPVAPLVHLLV